MRVGDPAADPWIIENAPEDPRAWANPLVAGKFGLRFYVAVPLRTHDGFNPGTLCVIDREPRTATDEQVAHLKELAELVVTEMELRLAARNVVLKEARLRYRAESIAALTTSGDDSVVHRTVE